MVHQAETPWHFDLRSALIGAILAWMLALILYRYRESLREKAKSALAPLVALKARWQRSAEEKYADALRERLRTYLLGEPRRPSQVLIPPRFRVEEALPSTLADAARPTPYRTLTLPALLRGHPRLLISGEEGSGRTASLAAIALHVLNDDKYFPIWLDLEPDRLAEQEAEERSPLQQIAALAAQSIPHAQERMLARRLAEGQALILVNGWERLEHEQRRQVAAWLSDAAELLPTARWIIAVSPRGSGWLIERGFVPLLLQPPAEDEAQALYAGWANLMEKPTSAEFEALLHWAIAGGDGYLHLTLRTLLHLRHDEAPERFAEVLRAWQQRLLLPSASEASENAAIAAEASRITVRLIQQLAYRSRVEGQPLDAATLREALEALLPPEETRDSQWVEWIKRKLDSSRLLAKSGRQLRFRHLAWADLFAAKEIAERQQEALLLDRVEDPDWHFLIECTIALGNGEALVRHQLKRALQEQESAALLRVARWAILAPTQVRWRKPVLLALAQTFTRKGIDFESRLELGKALALVVGEEARPFYLKALRHPDLEVRAAALRGLGWTGTPREMQVLSAATNDPHERIREAAVRALGDLGTGGALRLLRDLLYGGEEATTLIVAETLAATPAGWDLLKEASEDPDLLVRRAAAHGLGLVPQPWAEELLTRMAREDSEWLVRSAADAALSSRRKSKEEDVEIPPPPAVDSLPWLINWAAQHGLGVGVGEAAYAALLHALEHGEPEAQILAARTLLRVGREEDLESLRQALRKAEDAEARRVLESALREMEARYARTPSTHGSSEAK